MATYTLDSQEAIFYRNGVSGVSRIVGSDRYNGSVATRVARYVFDTPVEGASKVSITFYSSGLWTEDGVASTHIPIRFFVGTDQDSHIDADSTYEYTGELTLGSDYTTFTGEANVVLLPNTTYYLWFFPGEDQSFGCYQWYRENYTSELVISGAGGVVYIDNGSSLEMYQCYVDNGTDWDLYIPYIDNGTNWDICG
jgi:hypothetical protein